MVNMHEDTISKLPKDILISIISRLTVQEATATSILSRYWRHLHCYITRLNFTKFRCGIDNKSNYVCMVEHILNSHRGGRIEEFRLDMLACGKFVRWFEFALTKKAETIHIVMLHQSPAFHGLRNTNGLACLKDLYLSHIKMTDQDFEFLISNCLALECLTINICYKLENISIVGLSKLKHLNLSFLWGLRSIAICDTISLVSLTSREWRIGCSVHLHNIPKLTKLEIGDKIQNVVTHVEFITGMSSCIRDQLQLLCLSSRSVSMYKLNLKLLNESSLQLVNIKHLELVLDTRNDPACYYVSRYACRLVEACPSLEKLLIKLTRTSEWLHGEVGVEAYDHRGCDLSKKYLEITGYSGSLSERELALYVINNVTTLKKVIVRSLDEEALSRARLDFGHIELVNVSVI